MIMGKVSKILRLWRFYYFNKPSAPWSSMIYLTSKCNLNCPMCWRHTDFGKEYVSKPELTTADFKRVITELNEMGCKKLSFAGGGEPVIQKNFLELAQLAKSFDMECDLVTNGTLLLDMIPELEKIGWDNVSISLDGHTKEINDKIRGKGFVEVYSALAVLIRSKINVGIASVIHPLNYKYLDKMVEFANYNGVKTVNFQPYMELNEKVNKEMKKELPAILKKALGKSRELKINTNIQELIDYGFLRESPKIKCILPWIQLQIDDKGNVRPCCILYEESWGNVRESSLNDIWVKGFSKLRGDFKKGIFAKECVNCSPLSYKFNKKMNRILIKL